MNFIDYDCFSRSLPKGDIDILVENSSPYLFKTGQKSIQRMKAFVEYNAINVSSF